MQQEALNPNQELITQIENKFEELKGHFDMEFVGGGFQGTVYKAREKVFKIVNYKYQYWRQELHPLFENEIKIYSDLHKLAICNYIPPFFPNDTSQNNLWFSAAYMNLGTLWKVGCISLQNMSPNLMLSISAELLKILKFLHLQNSIYHYDIKPDNVLFHQEYQLVQSGQTQQTRSFEQGILEILSKRNNQITQHQIENLQNYKKPDYFQQQSILKTLQSDQIWQSKIETLSFDEIVQLIYLVEGCTKRQNFNPKDLVIRKQAKIVLCDFGFAKHKEIPKWTVGTLRFISPYLILLPKSQQLLQQDTQSIARQCDLFSFGMTIFHLLWKNQNLFVPDPNFYNSQEFNSVRKSLYEEISNSNPGFKFSFTDTEQVKLLFFYKNVISVLQNVYDSPQYSPIQSIVQVLLKILNFNFQNLDEAVYDNLTYNFEWQAELQRITKTNW